MSQTLDLEQLAIYLRRFVTDRNWDQFHTPKNLAMAVAGEAGELAAIFQWLTAEESESLGPEELQNTSDELADIIIYLVRLADMLDIDLGPAVDSKMANNEARYTVEESWGSAKKR